MKHNVNALHYTAFFLFHVSPKNVQRQSQEIDDTECMALGELAITFSLAGLYIHYPSQSIN
jgi:hypothetical protein